MARFRLRSLVPLEADVQSAVEGALLHLHAHGVVAWFARINGGGAMVTGRGGKPRFLEFYRLQTFGKPRRKGISDIIGQLTCGRSLAIEVKRAGEPTTTEQAEFIERVNKHGGVGFVARGVEDVFSGLSVTKTPIS